MKILMAGSSGLIGSELCKYLLERGNTVTHLVRNKQVKNDNEVYWKPSNEEINRSSIEGYDAVINLCGENVASGRWTEKKKRRIHESRVDSTQFLSEQISKLTQKPKVLINASAVGFYGDRGEEILEEDTEPGDLFLAKVCQEWEKATRAAEEAGIRVVRLRMGVVITPQGGVLKSMILPFKLGLGGVLGSGKQYMSWISIDDLVRVYHLCLEKESLEGPINAVAPHPVTNQQFTKLLGKTLKRPTFLSMPEWVIRLLFGQMGEELLLASTRASPCRLQQTGYSFIYPRLDEFFEHKSNEF